MRQRQSISDVKSMRNAFVQGMKHGVNIRVRAWTMHKQHVQHIHEEAEIRECHACVYITQAYDCGPCFVPPRVLFLHTQSRMHCLECRVHNI